MCEGLQQTHISSMLHTSGIMFRSHVWTGPPPVCNCVSTIYTPYSNSVADARLCCRCSDA
jgi:hypothetical protein